METMMCPGLEWSGGRRARSVLIQEDRHFSEEESVMPEYNEGDRTEREVWSLSHSCSWWFPAITCFSYLQLIFVFLLSPFHSYAVQFSPVGNCSPSLLLFFLPDLFPWCPFLKHYCFTLFFCFFRCIPSYPSILLLLSSWPDIAAILSFFRTRKSICSLPLIQSFSSLPPSFLSS